MDQFGSRWRVRAAVAALVLAVVGPVVAPVRPVAAATVWSVPIRVAGGEHTTLNAQRAGTEVSCHYSLPEVYSTRAGTVVEVGRSHWFPAEPGQPGGVWFVLIDHGDGWASLYDGLSAVWVGEGTRLGGPRLLGRCIQQLHFAVRRQFPAKGSLADFFAVGLPVDPRTLVDLDRGVPDVGIAFMPVVSDRLTWGYGEGSGVSRSSGPWAPVLSDQAEVGVVFVNNLNVDYVVSLDGACNGRSLPVSRLSSVYYSCGRRTVARDGTTHRFPLIVEFANYLREPFYNTGVIEVAAYSVRSQTTASLEVADGLGGPFGPVASRPAGAGGVARLAATNTGDTTATVEVIGLVPTAALGGGECSSLGWASIELKPREERILYCQMPPGSTPSAIHTVIWWSLDGWLGRWRPNPDPVLPAVRFTDDGARPVPAKAVFASAPARLLDTRPEAPANHHRVLGMPAGGTLTVPHGTATPGSFKVDARSVAPSGATALIAKVTVADADLAGWLAAQAGSWSGASVLAYGPHHPQANEVFIPLAPDGTFTLSPSAGHSVHVVVDVAGYFTGASSPPNATTYVASTGGGARLLDTRPQAAADLHRISGMPAGGAIGAQTDRVVPVAGLELGDGYVVPFDAVAVQLSVTSIGPGPPGWADIRPSGEAYSGTSAITVGDGETATVSATVRLGPDGAVTLRPQRFGHYVIDVAGYYTTRPEGMRYVAATPLRIEDTRTALTGMRISGAPAAALPVATRGRLLDSAGAVAVRLNVTSVGPGAGYVTVWPEAAGTARPLIAQLNPATGQTPANGMTVPLSSDRTVSAVYVTGNGQPTDLVIDLQGYWVN